MKAHAFYEKDNDTGCWMVYCREEKGRFSTKLWRDNKVPDQQCPCCGGSMKDELSLKDDESIREQNERKYGHAAVTGDGASQFTIADFGGR